MTLVFCSVASNVVLHNEFVDSTNLQRRLMSTAPKRLSNYSFKSFYISKTKKDHLKPIAKLQPKVEPIVGIFIENIFKNCNSNHSLFAKLP